MKVLVSGATGFIGNHVVKYLLGLKDIEIITTSIDSIEEVKSKYEWYKEVEYISLDLNYPMENYFKFF